MKWHPRKLDEAIVSASFIKCESNSDAKSCRLALRRRLTKLGLHTDYSTEVRDDTVWITRNPHIVLSSDLI